MCHQCVRCKFSDPSLPTGVAALAKMATTMGRNDAIARSHIFRLWNFFLSILAKFDLPR